MGIVTSWKKAGNTGGTRKGGGAFVSMALLATGALLAACTNPFLTSFKSSVAPPSFSPGGGVFGTDQSVTLSAVSGAAIYYTTDGSTPSAASARYSGPIPVAGNGTAETVKAVAVEGGASSAVAAADFTINYSIGGTSTLASPAFSPAGGQAPNNQLIALSYPAGASAYYTTNGTTPSASNGALYTAPFAISGANGVSVTVRAVAVEPGLISSPVVSAGFVITYSADTVVPTIAINASSGGALSSSGSNLFWVTGAPPSITISGGSSTTTYYYVVSYDNQNPNPPTSSSSSATGPSATITLSPPDNGFHTVTVEAMAVDPSTTQGPVATSTWYLNESVATPIASVSSGRFGTDQSVTFSDSSSGAQLTVSGTSTDYLSGGSAWTGGSISLGPATTVTLPAIGPLGGYVVTATASLQGWVSASLGETYYIVYPKITLATQQTLSIPTIPSTLAGGPIQSLIAKMWGGAGGGGWGYYYGGGPGGGGGFAQLSVSTSGGDSYQVGVGGGGPGGSAGTGDLGGVGGGMSYFYDLTTSSYLAIAGGGGGGGEGGYGGSSVGAAGGGGGVAGASEPDGGGGGAPGIGGVGGIGGTSTYVGAVNGNNGSNIGTTPGSGGTGGASISVPPNAPNWVSCGAGGQGYGGGGSGGEGTAIDCGGGGGGGNLGDIAVDGSGQTPGNSTDSDLSSGLATGGAGGAPSANGSNGTSGLVVIYVN